MGGNREGTGSSPVLKACRSKCKMQAFLPWLVWLSGLSTSLRTEGSPVRFPIIPKQGTCLGSRSPVGGRGNYTLMFLALSSSLPSPLSKNKINLKMQWWRHARVSVCACLCCVHVSVCWNACVWCFVVGLCLYVLLQLFVCICVSVCVSVCLRKRRDRGERGKTVRNKEKTQLMKFRTAEVKPLVSQGKGVGAWSG